VSGRSSPKKCTFYIQSSITEEMIHMYVSIVIPLDDLLFKHPDNVNYGLVGYPDFIFIKKLAIILPTFLRLYD
jgi:tryptophanyl-tRNA synthetase